MARPYFTSNLFGTNQRIKKTVTVYNTPNTTESNGIIYRPASSTANFGSGITFSSASRAAMDSHFDSNGIPGIVNNAGNEVYGRIPVVYDYWGTGSPIGVSRANSTLLRYTGYVKNTGSYGLGFFGRGRVKVFQNDAEIAYGYLDEFNPVTTSGLVSMTAGDKIDIFYWGVDVNWGGIAGRVFTDANTITAGEIDWDLMREAPILSASFMDDNQAVSSFTIPEVTEISTRSRVGQVQSLEVKIAQSDVRGVVGWKWNNSVKKLTNIETSDEIALGNLVKVSSGVFGDEHPIFTGHIVDIVPSDDVVVIRLMGSAARLSQQLTENLPDRLSYAANGYIKRLGSSEPVWAVPAYDHWPYEFALKDMLARAWVDSSLMEGFKKVKRVGQSTTENGSKLFRVRGLNDQHIKLKRQANYGNPKGDDPNRPIDDDYLTPSELTQTLYKKITDMLDTIGYDFGSDEEGYFFARPRNNAQSMMQVTGGVDTTNPAAIGGQYQTFTGTGWSVTLNGIKAGRIDLIVGVGPSLGTLAVTATRQEDGAVFNTTIDTSNPTEYFYYDKIYDIELNNLTSYAIVSGADYGTFDVQITPLGGGGATEYRLDALKIYDQDPEVPTSDFNLTNLKNLISLQGKSNFSERINDAIVTGKRTAAITDSSKALERIETEFVTSRATDVNSILNPNAINYIGKKITAYLSNEAIGSQDLADWASQTLVAHYRLPEADAQAEHTILPILELRDPVTVNDVRFDYFDGNDVLWVVGFSHTITSDRAMTMIELSTFSEPPSYEPREEIDLSLYNNKPVINLDISYPSLNGTSTISNPTDRLPVQSDLVVDSGSISSSSLTVSAGTVSPGSELLWIDVTSDITQLSSDPASEPFPERYYFKNNPYHRFYAKSGTNLALVFEMADGSSAYTPGGWGIQDGESAIFTWHRITDAYTGTPPFYDPYYSELSVPELVTISFDGLVSGYYRVSIVDAKDESQPKTVAWLTQPDASSTEPEDHWEYQEASTGISYVWDGVDNIGDWNRTQTDEYSYRQSGNFDSIDNPIITRGFYAANDKSTGMIHISAELDGGEAVYPIGNYAQFFVRIEVLRDSDNIPLKVESNIPADLRDSANAELTDRYIYYHLPQPNKATITINDWQIAGGDYDPLAPGNSWGAEDVNATFRDKKPVRVTITPKQRRGAKFAADEANANLKITRVAHLSANIFDLSAVHFGKKWNQLLQSAEEKRVVARRYTVDDHTLEITDDSFNSPDAPVNWVFYPSQFEVDFGNGQEAIEYQNYLQLTEVPSWNPKRLPGEERSRLIFSMINYLFYLSVYTQDRSGRLVWAVDESFIDKSKILGNTQTTKHPEDVERHQRRTIYVRQWWDYEQLDQNNGSSPSGWNLPTNLYGGFADVYDYHNASTVALYPNSSGTLVTGSTVTGSADRYTDDLVNRNRHVLLAGGSTARDLTSFGNWTWEDDGIYWIANISRDFHPFYIVPPMALAGYEGEFGAASGGNKRGPFWRQSYFYGIVDYRGNDNLGDVARFDSWFTRTVDYNGTLSDDYVMAPGRSVLEKFEKSAVPSSVIEYQRQDDIKHYEMIRGGMSNGAGNTRDLISVVGGDPYYQNVKLYRYFRMSFHREKDINAETEVRWYNDVYRKGFFHVTFRHTYNWESSSLFPVDQDRALVPGALDSDLTGSPIRAFSYDPGAYTGWKDDHPSSTQEGTWVETGTCSGLHWRNDYGNNGYWFNRPDADAGSSCAIDDPTVPLPFEVLPRTYTTGKNIFTQRYISTIYKKAPTGDLFYARQSYMPMAVGPRLPETRRALFNVTLVNERRENSI